VRVPAQGPRAVDDCARFPAHPLYRSLYEDDSSEIESGPGDSHFEWSYNVGAFDDDSQVDVPAFVAPEPEPKQIEAASVSLAARVGNGAVGGARSEEPKQIQVASVSKVLAAQPVPIMRWNGRFVDFWSRYQLVTTLGFGALASGVLGFFLLNASIAGNSLAPATSTLVVGFIGTVAFVLISLNGLALNSLLIDLARELRRLQNDLN